MLKQFQRRAHHYITDKPETLVEWLALIQHYGGPTRLLDFSHSFYVAAFLAIETAHDDAAVWAVNLAFLDDALDQAKERFPDIAKKSEIEIAESCLEGTLVPKLVLKVEPNRLNERLSIQQGLFLLPTDLSLSFKENFCATFGEGDMFQSPKETEYGGEFTEELDHDLSGTKVIKIIIPRGIHRRAVMDLQYMNVASATLFPGLDGFARSLRHYLRAYDKYDDPDKP